jgi:hypothetical protein
MSIPVPPHLVARRYIHVDDNLEINMSEAPELVNVVFPKLATH